MMKLHQGHRTEAVWYSVTTVLKRKNKSKGRKGD